MASNISSSSKRKRSDHDDSTRQACKYGVNCYRNNPLHFKEYSHPEELLTFKKQKMNLKKISHGLHFTTVAGIDKRYNEHPVAVSIEELLSDMDDKLIESIQFNYMIDLPWLIKRYPESARSKPILIVHGYNGTEKTDLESEAMNFPNVALLQAKLPIAYGTHHSKMMVLFYEYGVQIVIHTANLIPSDWYQKTQGVWVSPLFKKLSCDDDNSEKDSFKHDLLDYLSSYGSVKLHRMVDKLKAYNMKTTSVHIVGSVPGRHTGNHMQKWGHLKLRKLLCDHGPSKDLFKSKWPVIGQFSSIGSLGVDSSKWLCSEWLDSLSTCRGGDIYGKQLKLIFPTNENVRNSLEGYSAGGSLPYSVQTAMKQRYLKEYLHQWKADDVGRSLASPHIKTYTRLSEESKSSCWFLLTSANLSKAAWGAYEKNQSQYMIRSYEIGVLLTPPHHDDRDVFLLDGGDSSLHDTFVLIQSKGPTQNHLRLPFDVPLTPYGPGDKPWVWDIRYTKEDSHGRLWVPT